MSDDHVFDQQDALDQDSLDQGGLDGIAIVGMAGRFPGAANIDEYWANLLGGIESITRFAPHELSPLVPPEDASHPRYVPVRGVLADADRFDAEFFGISPREALLIDPQQRVFLELCWNALEHAGVDTATFPGTIGVYAGTSNNTYRKLVESRADLMRAAGEFAAAIGSEKDYVATRVAHRLDLTGPAISIHTACSTSLVAVSQAWYALMSGQCDVAIAGGINIVVPQESGHIPIEGGIESEDGHCRPFDAQSTGTIFSSGGAVVVLKRLSDALEQGDTIWSVIRGVAVNNDGGDKASFSAPSVRGQSAVIRQALATAGVGADSISYVEAHGTATPLGDPIEVEALTRAFRADTDASGFCWLGSAKSNFGHLVAAAGVAGLIKATLSLWHERIPPTLHFSAPNPNIDFAATPFRVADREIAWPRGATPRRAGVSSFGVGGTNAHVVLEEAPRASAPSPGRAFTVLPLSARNEFALRLRASELATALETFNDDDLPDIGHTLALGRQPMPHRACVVASSVAQARERLASITAYTSKTKPRLVFLFPGQGAQHANMARELVESEPVFRDSFARCCVLASALLSRDLRALILPEAGQEEAANAALAETRFTQPALFAIEYALAELWESWGCEASAMIGHSIGEYVAACRAGVFSLEDAMRLVVARGAAMFAQPSGGMLAIRLGEKDLAPRLPNDVVIAALNAPALTVVAGAQSAVDAFATQLLGDSIAASPLRVSHAFHSPLMDDALPIFRKAFEGVTLSAPQRVFYSCVSGLPINAAEATSIDYWCRQLRQPVRFADALQHAAIGGPTLCLEVGPSQNLTGLARGMLDDGSHAIASLGPASRPGDAREQIALAFGQGWCEGLQPDWARYEAGQSRRLVGLPGYPFRGARYWIDSVNAPSTTSTAAIAASPMAAGDFHMQVPSMPQPAASIAPPRRQRLATELRELFENLSGERIAAEDEAVSFLDLGLDSLALTQAALELERHYGIKLKFRRLLEDLDSIARLTDLFDATLPPDPVQAVAPMAAAASMPVASSMPAVASDQPLLAQLIQSQMAFMAQQTELLRALSGAPGTVNMPSVVATTAKAATIEVPPEEALKADLKERPFGASARITTRKQFEPTQVQEDFLAKFIRDYNARSGKSKSFSQQHRQLMADPRVVTGFNPLWKDLVYPIVINRSRGARMWDLDGNEYIDLLNGFGANFLGYQPEYITAALNDQVEKGFEIGPQHPLTADVSALISEMTGMERVAFCNTGSEAVMGAMRVARTVTGRKTIVVFRDSYHGIFDEVIVRGSRQLRSIAAAPGILANAVENVLVLDYGSDEALRIIAERSHELAAVMIEPVQSRNPTLQPRAFVHELRRLCDEGGCALIFDEIITGFRIAPGGAQEFYGVRADLATYGKIIGGGLPFAAIGGRTRWMDALDGGHWQYGDDSYPEAGVTYFAGTFVRHPLALAAAHAALTFIKEQGAELQQRLNARAAALVERLNEIFAARHAPLTAVGFSSLWKIRADEDQPCASLFWYWLRQEGMHVYEQFNCFLSVAHGDVEVQRIVAAVTSAVDALMGAGLLTPRGHVPALASPAAQPLAAIASDRAVPSTEPQREVWLAAKLSDEASLAYNESSVLRLRGALDRTALKRTLQDLLDRHDALRATFSADGETLIVPAHAEVTWVETDLSASTEAQREAVLADRMRNAVTTPFDLERGPLFRAELARCGDEEHVLILAAHHIVCDGWSWWVIVRDLASLYGTRAGVNATPLPPAESFADYALAQADPNNQPELAADEAYWLARYAGSVPALDLPTDRPRLSRRTFASAREDHVLDAALVTSVKRLGAKHRASLFATLLGTFGAVLARLAGQEEVVIGIPAAAQAIDGHDELVGHGVNLLPLRCAPDLSGSFGQLLDASRVMLLDALEHQQYTFGTLLKKLGIARDPSRLPLVSVMFNIDQALDHEATAFPGLAMDFSSTPRAYENFELFVNAVQEHGQLRLECQYNRDLFDADTVRHWLRAYETLLRAAVERPDDPLGRLPLVDGQTRRVLDALQPEATPFDSKLGVHQMFEAQCDRTPERVALRFNGRTLTYAGLDSRANRIAHLLRARGVGRGSLVGIALDRGVNMVSSMLGVLKAGAGYVPLDPAFPKERLVHMVDDADLAALITQSDHATRFDLRGKPVLELDRLMSEFNAAPPTRLLRDGESAGGESIAYVIYTSGSTGQPKGVEIPHRAVVNFLASMIKEPGLHADDRLVAVTTLSFDIAVLELFGPLSVGGEVVLARREDAMDGEELKALLASSEATLMQATPATWRMLLQSGWNGGKTFRALCGGEALAPDLAAQLLACCGEVWNLYGPTETTVWSTCWKVEHPEQGISIGTPIANTVIRMLDEQKQLCPVGVPGEIWIGGAGVALGYRHRAELTAERFIADPFEPGARLYRTGDRGRWLANGTLEHLGRLDFQVKLRGFRIELGEIESVARADSAVSDCVAVAHAFSAEDQRLVLYVASNEAEETLFARLRERLSTTLPAYMMPQHLVRLAALPRTPNGKTDRKALPAPTAVAVAPVTTKVAPRDELEQTVAAAMAAALGSAGLGVDDNFFEHGGHSLLVAQLTARLNKQLNLALPLRTVFEAPTVARLAAAIRASGNDTHAFPPIQPLADRSSAPLSILQQRLMYIEQMRTERVAYNTPSAHRLRGPMNLPLFERAVQEVVRRQAALRTSIDTSGDEPRQIIHDDVTVRLQPVEDLSHFPESEREAQLQRRLDALILEPIDLDQVPLFRTRMFRLGEREHVFFFMVHHIVWDGWSFDLLYTEMSAIYSALLAGEPNPLPPLAVQYGDFAAWHRQWMQGDELTRRLVHWKNHLKGDIEPLELPADRLRPPRMTGAGGTRWIHLSNEMADQVRLLGQRAEATTFMVLLTIHFIFLYRHSGQRSLIVGTPVRGREVPELETVMGYFVNAIPLRVLMDPEASFLDCLRMVRDVVVGAFSYPEVPFDQLVAELKIPRDASRPPLYQSMFSFQDVRARDRSWGDLEHDRVTVFQQGAADDIGLWFVQHGRGLRGGLTYNADIFDAATAERFCERFESLLVSALRDPVTPISHLELIADSEKRALEDWNETELDVAQPYMHSMVEAQIRSTPDRIAVRCDEQSVSYAELDARANRFAHALRARGAQRGTLVGIALDRGVDMVATVLAVLRTGAGYVPLDPAFPPDRLAFMVEDAGLKVLVTESKLAERFTGGEHALLLLDDAQAGLDAQPSTPLPVDGHMAQPESIAYVIYTSGSTGQPKGVEIPHRAVVNFLASMIKEPGLHADDRLVAVTTLSFDIAVLELFGPLSVGGEVVLARREDAMDGEELKALLASSEATLMQATPATWRMLLQSGWNGGKTFRALCGGEALAPDLAAQLLACCGEVWNLYGPTETTVWSTCWKVEHPEQGISIGTPIANTVIRMLDEQKQLCPVGVPGEIWIGGAGVALGYRHRAELTAERFIADPFEPGARLYRTGDRGRWLANGTLEHLGRLDFQVKLRGFRIELGEIESVAREEPAVKDCVAIAYDVNAYDRRLVLYVVSEEAEDTLLPRLRTQLVAQLPGYMQPQHLVWLHALPQTPNGKVDRKALPAPQLHVATDRDAARAAPLTDPRQRYLGGLWCELIGVPHVQPSDNFFDVGGHSLLAVELVARVRRELGVRLNLLDVATGSLASLAVDLPEPGLEQVRPATLGARLKKLLGFAGRSS